MNPWVPFLEARFREDEEHIAGLACECSAEEAAPGCARRLAADLVGKREIVRGCAAILAGGNRAVGAWLARLTLMNLALPYAWHEDWPGDAE